MEIREATLEAAQQVHAAVPEFDEGRLDAKYRDKDLDAQDPLVLVAAVDGDDAGYCVAYDKFGDGSCYVWMAGVVPAHRRKGVMSALLDRVEDVARDRGYDAVTIKTRNARTEMRHLLVDQGYAVCGYEPVGAPPRHEIMHRKAL